MSFNNSCWNWSNFSTVLVAKDDLCENGKHTQFISITLSFLTPVKWGHLTWFFLGHKQHTIHLLPEKLSHVSESRSCCSPLSSKQFQEHTNNTSICSHSHSLVLFHRLSPSFLPLCPIYLGVGLGAKTQITHLRPLLITTSLQCPLLWVQTF